MMNKITKHKQWVEVEVEVEEKQNKTQKMNKTDLWNEQECWTNNNGKCCINEMNDENEKKKENTCIL